MIWKGNKNKSWRCDLEKQSQMWFRTKLIIFMIGSMLILGFQYLAWKAKIHAVDPANYAKHAVDLKVTREMRYGFFQSFHGAFLVKTENLDLRDTVEKDIGEESGKQNENDEEFNSGVHASDSTMKPDRKEGKDALGIDEVMRKELELVPVKTSLESVLYLAVFMLIFWGPSRFLKLRFIRKCGPFWRCFLSGMISGAIFFWLMAMPLIIFNYGLPLFSTYIGPGALSFSSGLVRISYGGGLTVSYRFVIEMLIFWPRIFYLIFVEIIPNWANPLIFFVIFAPSLYGGVLGMYQVLWMDFRQLKRRQAKNLAK